MTIDECILDCIHYTSTDLCKYEGINWSKSQIEQIAEWLEELKDYRKIGTVEECRNCVIEILKAYNKALDDVYEILLEEAPRNYAGELEFGGSVKYLSANGAHKIVKKLKNRLVDLCKEVLDEQTIGGKKSNE